MMDSSPSTNAEQSPENADPPGPIARVRRPKTAARDRYDSLSGWYDAVVDPFEGPARSVGVDLTDVRSDEDVLDVGCGTGTALVAFARTVDASGSATGVDLSREMCRIARRKLAAAGVDSGAVVQGDAASLPFRDRAFDAVFASFVLDLFDTPEILSVLAEWSRVLAPEGRLCVVSLSRRTGGPLTRLYEAVHDRFPVAVDCRPIYVRETLREAGFDLAEARDVRAWGLPVEVVLARPDRG